MVEIDTGSDFVPLDLQIPELNIDKSELDQLTQYFQQRAKLEAELKVLKERRDKITMPTQSGATLYGYQYDQLHGIGYDQERTTETLRALDDKDGNRDKVIGVGRQWLYDLITSNPKIFNLRIDEGTDYTVENSQIEVFLGETPLKMSTFKNPILFGLKSPYIDWDVTLGDTSKFLSPFHFSMAYRLPDHGRHATYKGLRNTSLLGLIEGPGEEFLRVRRIGADVLTFYGGLLSTIHTSRQQGGKQ